jgi:tRNA A-37 threonylcarbamoyl transferase component Bud32
MRGGESGTGKLHAVCRACGKPWPADYARCPDDGTALTARHAIHLRSTLYPPTPPGFEDAPATLREAPGLAELAEPDDPDPPVEHLRVSAMVALASPSMPPLDATDPAPASPLAAPPRRAPGASDPPTASRRRYLDHIELPPGSVVHDDYEIDARLGAGTMGEVYAARHLRLGKRVAIKVIAPRLSRDPAAVDRFSREARALARIHHPGIVAVEHIGDLPDGRAYFVMERLDGEPLDARLVRGRLALDDALDVLDQVARALEAAHLQGVTHRDLKPANIFLCQLPGEPRPLVKLLDFGVAKLAASGERLGQRTQSGVAIGTPMYMSPEQTRGPDIDSRTDVYALGCLAYELILGSVPYPRALSVAALVAAHLHEPTPAPRAAWPGIPPALDLLMFSLIAKDPAYRPTLPQVRHVIASLRAEPTGPAGAAAVSDPGLRSVRRTSPYLTLLIAGVALLGGIAIGATVLGHRAGGAAPGREPPTAGQPERR